MKKRALKGLKAGVKHKKVSVSAKDAKIKQDLGGGFFRYVFFRTIGANQFYTFTFFGGSQKTISGGWWIANNTQFVATPVSSYSQNDRDWIIVLFNPTSFARSVAFTFITKT
ncbi:hypothetical protein [Ammoniphilus resinae]|uniref:Uncharacterized protein n=1 Tax=Ammoniphilus resinae TaxID=861532 RepID=A0ABS4GPG7_9BACL|nr:hypothetical protein [Ammoniphilus resinae]MBP1932136.1 hypothetical protein [Ammoniphilus resinae]